MGIDGILGHSNIAEITNNSVTAAGSLITKQKNTGLIIAVRGYVKGKHKFMQNGSIRLLQLFRPVNFNHTWVS